MIIHQESPTYPANEKIFNVKSLAQHLDISRDAVRRLVAEGMPHLRIGYRTVRFDLPTVMAWLDKRKQISLSECAKGASPCTRSLPAGTEGAPSLGASS